MNKHGPFFSTRQAGKADCRYIKSLGCAVFDLYGPYGEILSSWFSSEITYTVVASTQEGMSGFAMLALTSGIAELLAIAVEPDMRGMGVGGFLMDEVIRRARQGKVKYFMLHTAVDNSAAQGLFEKYGFVRSGIRDDFYPNGQDAFIMTRHIYDE